MNRTTAWLAFLLMIAAWFVIPGASLAAERDDEQDAERGIDLTCPTSDAFSWKAFLEDGARMSDVWEFRDGLIVCRGTPKGYLYSDRTFTNFTLRLQWRWPEGAEPGRGGVLMRMTGEHKIWPKSLEAQINAPDAGDFWGLDGYPLDGPTERKTELDHDEFGHLTNLKKTKQVERPAGAWNDYEITVRGDTVTLSINGCQVNQATGCEVVAGALCLTAEGDPIEFRKVRLAEIPLETNDAPGS